MPQRADEQGQQIVEGNFELNRAVIDALPVAGTNVISIHAYGQCVWAKQAKLLCQLPCGDIVPYFLKVTEGESNREMIEGQYESDKAMFAVSPAFCPQPFAWGKYESSAVTGSSAERYFLLAQFREVGQQPPEPIRFTALLADFHKRSMSPTGKVGFSTTTCHGKAQQLTDCWEDSWETLFRRQLEHVFAVDRQRQAPWPEYDFCAKLVLEKSIGRLLRPLETGGRSIKPCLIHGNIWDGNTATDMETGEPFIFDGSSFYGHNEYELGNWRTPRHRLSSNAYVRKYKRYFPASEPEEEWDSRNLLYSIRFNVTAAYLIPGSNYRQRVFEDMKEICRRTCREELEEYEREMVKAREASSNEMILDDDDREEEEHEEEEEFEEEEEEEEEE